MLDFLQNQWVVGIGGGIISGIIVFFITKWLFQRKDNSKYLEQIATPLIRAGLIKSVRGAQGGYSLTRDINKYTAKDILVAVEGPIACVACLETEPNQCPRYSECLTLPFYKGLNKVITDYLESYTLEDLADLHGYQIEYII